MLSLCGKPCRILDHWPVMRHRTIPRNVACDAISHEHLLALARIQTEFNKTLNIKYLCFRKKIKNDIYRNVAAAKRFAELEPRVDNLLDVTLQSSTKVFEHSGATR